MKNLFFISCFLLVSSFSYANNTVFEDVKQYLTSWSSDQEFQFTKRGSVVGYEKSISMKVNGQFKGSTYVVVLPNVIRSSLTDPNAVNFYINFENSGSIELRTFVDYKWTKIVENVGKLVNKNQIKVLKKAETSDGKFDREMYSLSILAMDLDTFKIILNEIKSVLNN